MLLKQIEHLLISIDKEILIARIESKIKTQPNITTGTKEFFSI